MNRIVFNPPCHFKLLLLFSAFFFCAPHQMDAQEYKEMMAEPEKFSVKEIQKSAEKYFDLHGKGKGSGYKQWKRWEFNAQRMVDDEGFLKSDQYYFHELARFNKERNFKNQGRAEACRSDWKAIGPIELNVTSGYNPGIGRITSFSIDPQDSSHIIIGAQTGGVWQSTDDGGNWTPLTDEYVNMVVYALTIDPFDSNTYYWGGDNGAIFKSLDQGSTWMEYSLGEPGKVNKIIVNPRNPQMLWASNDLRGIFLSEDGGMSWSKIVDEFAHDLELHPSDSNIVYASGSHLWKSTDGGYTFDTLTFEASNFEAKMMAVTPAEPDHLYVLQKEGGQFGGLFISRNLGKTFEEKDHGAMNFFGYDINGYDDAGQAPRDMDIVVSQIDTNEIFIAGINLWRSMNAGDSFEIITHWVYPDDSARHSYCHADIDILEWKDGGVYIGSDGGFYLLENSRDTAIWKETIIEKGKGINVHQFYRIGASQTDKPIVSGGAQDNGSSVWINGKWNSWFGADGMESFILNDQYQTIFGTYQGGGLFYSINGGQSVEYVFGLNDLQGNGNWVTPFEKDPTDSTTIYVGFDRIYKSSDYGFTFDTISQDIHPNLFKIAPTGSDTMYASSWSSLYRTRDGGATDWEMIFDGAAFNYPNINYIAIHPRNANLIALAVSGSEKVLISRDGGETWIPFAEELPDFQALCVTWQDNEFESLYLGMNYGIYYRDRLTQEWEIFSNGLPNVIINELEINAPTQEIYAGTYGRGLWASPVCDPITNQVEQEQGFGFNAHPNLTRSGTAIEINFSQKSQEKVELKVYDTNGYLYYHHDVFPSQREHIKIPTDGWDTGVYYLRATSSGKSFTQLINLL